MQESNQDLLIEKAQRGNPDAVGTLYELNHNSIYRYIYYRTGNSQAAEDLTADVFLKMVQALPGFHGSLPAFRGWLFQIARNLSIDHLRRFNAHPDEALSEQLSSLEAHPESSAEYNLQNQNLYEALAKLNGDQKDVILLRFVEGLPLAETGRILHKSEDAIKGLQHRALQTLRNYLIAKEMGYEPERSSSRIPAAD